MKTTSILRWPDYKFPYYQRRWVYDLKDGIFQEECIRNFEKAGKRCQEWHLTISDEDSCLLQLRFPKIQFL